MDARVYNCSSYTASNHLVYSHRFLSFFFCCSNPKFLIFNFQNVISYSEELALRLQREEMRAQDNQRNQPKSSPPATRNKSRDVSLSHLVISTICIIA